MNNSEFLDVTEASKFTTLSVQTLNNMRSQGSGPLFYKIGRLVRYSKSDLLAWMEQYCVLSTTEYKRKKQESNSIY